MTNKCKFCRQRLGLRSWFSNGSFCSEEHSGAFEAETQRLTISRLRAAGERFSWRMNGSLTELRKVS
jgi:hypothetical protein